MNKSMNKLTNKCINRQIHSPRRHTSIWTLTNTASPAPYLELGGRKVYVCNHLSTRMFHLQTRVQLQEIEVAVIVIEVLHRACVDVSNYPCQLNGSLWRGVEGVTKTKWGTCGITTKPGQCKRKNNLKCTDTGQNVQRNWIWWWKLCLNKN